MPNNSDRQSVVIGGFATEEDAIHAGEYAKKSPQDKELDKLTQEQQTEWFEANGYGWSWRPQWDDFSVIPSEIPSPKLP